MRNFKAIIQYEGTRYQGWQRQERTGQTIQGKLTEVLTRLDGRDVEVIGSGRTDAGVHALGQTANFHLQTTMTAEQIRDYCNRYLPEDIAVISLSEMPERFHARYLARRKTYLYRVRTTPVPNVFERRYVYSYPNAEQTFSVSAMREAAALLCGTHDFKAFSSSMKGKKSTIRTIEEIRIEEQGGELKFMFTGDGFLYHMVRILVGTLLEVGTGERQPQDMTAILQAKTRALAGPTVPACGLCLLSVTYEDE